MENKETCSIKEILKKWRFEIVLLAITITIVILEIIDETILEKVLDWIFFQVFNF